ncbi:Flavin-linked sulfhydryl oxidase of the mitochondrial IMS [Hypoxylon texense]
MEGGDGMTGSYITEWLSEDVVVEASKLFSENYGIWAKPPPGEYCPGKPDGHAFVCRWEYEGRQVCWITQLVIHRRWGTEERLMKVILRHLVHKDDRIIGIISPNPVACKALASVFAGRFEKQALGTRFESRDWKVSNIPVDFARERAAGVMAASPIGYIQNAKLRGSLFDAHDATGLRCGVDTKFFIDHSELELEVALLQETENWPLGDLPDGHEFLLLFDVESVLAASELGRTVSNAASTSVVNSIRSWDSSRRGHVPLKVVRRPSPGSRRMGGPRIPRVSNQ